MAGSCWEPINWISDGCELSNNETMFLELSIAGIIAITLSLFFYQRQNFFAKKLHTEQEQLSKKLFQLQNKPNLYFIYHNFIPRTEQNRSIFEPHKFEIRVKNKGLSKAIISRIDFRIEVTNVNGF